MTNTQFNTVYTSLSSDGTRYNIAANKNVVDALRKREWIDKYYTVTFNGLLAALEAILKSNRSNGVKQMEIARISAAIARFKLQ